MTNIDSHVRSRFSKTLSIPSALNGRAFIDIAKSGSGKVNAFIWSAIVHMMTQIKHQVDDITIVLICAPQRELAEQLHLEYKQYEKPRNINSVGAFDSGNMHEQIMSCHKECEILVCAPDSLIDLIKRKRKPQVRSIADRVNSDQQRLLLKRNILTDRVPIVQGEVSEGKVLIFVTHKDNFTDKYFQTK
ncbi:unnamed protein product [Rotaria sp. Silwood1]|nr:unnamed protein product [Rotaria sp. Silwood1]CAF1001477.1 unnamed protein product [Rotaria sp. Silwood1]